MIKKIKNLPWGAISGVIGAIITMSAAYISLRKPVPMIKADMISESNVLDVHTPLEELAILFQGEDIQENNLNLRILTTRFENTGDINIRQGDFDQRNSWGLRLSNGQIIRARLIDSNSKHIRENLNPKRAGIDSVAFETIIFDKRDHFTIEILVIHPKDTLPEVAHFGKIAGIDSIAINEFVPKESTPSFIKEAFAGDLKVQSGRLIAYSLSTILLMVLMVWVSVQLDDRKMAKEKTERKLLVQQNTKGRIKIKKGGVAEYLAESYIEGGRTSLTDLLKLLEDKERLAAIIRRFSPDESMDELEFEEDLITALPQIDIYGRYRLYRAFVPRLLDSPAVRLTDSGEIEINEVQIQKILGFIKMLKGEEE